MLKKLTLLAMLTFLVGCSTQLGYRFADTIIEWQLSSIVELRPELQRDVDQVITDLHQWHAREEMPRYHQELTKIRTAIANDEVDAAFLDTSYEAVWQAWQRILEQLEPHAQSLLPRLNDAERAQLRESLEQRQQQQIEEFKERQQEDQPQRRLQRAEKNIKTWLGSVNSEQRQLLRQWLAQRVDNQQQWLLYSMQWQAQFLLLVDYPQQQDFEQQLKLLMFSPHELRSDELQQSIEANRVLTTDLVLAIYASMDAKQKRHLLRKIDGYLDDIDGIVRYYQ
ncbi:MULTISPECIES: DUF6279 family lipoprotein [Idiomarina]|uniref:DUF6279 family lipoprotein n=1 Tax=Idiomarina TaxID=135575 RepID=UPI00129A5C92|nr:MULTISPECIES: DUF6279 family lipoprotein [Idiomarina]MRJ40848.1 hypothetical protein [Idiomarina sp. FeN1]NCU56652.1 hypothetical protein [Idiomarina sp. FenA--70]NCU59032.1 hypothetical protein [Idiomarina sp. FenBw--71]UUN14474.1 hypothetical protein KGF88_04470 [Idiomarina loihiensis]